MKTKHIFLSLAFFILSLTSFAAQDTLLVNPVKIDSLKQLIDLRTKADEEKVGLLNEYARLCFYNQEYLKGFIATRDARDLSKKLGFRGGEVMYQLTLAAFFGNGNMYSYRIRQAKDLAQKANKKLSEYFIDLNIPHGYPPKQDE